MGARGAPPGSRGPLAGACIPGGSSWGPDRDWEAQNPSHLQAEQPALIFISSSKCVN